MRNRLQYVKFAFKETVEIAATIINNFLNEHGCKIKIKNELIEILRTKLNFQWLLDCSEHYDKNKMHIVISTINICIKRHCILKNRQFIEDASKKVVKRKINILKTLKILFHLNTFP